MTWWLHPCTLSSLKAWEYSANDSYHEMCQGATRCQSSLFSSLWHDAGAIWKLFDSRECFSNFTYIALLLGTSTHEWWQMPGQTPIAVANKCGIINGVITPKRYWRQPNSVLSTEQNLSWKGNLTEVKFEGQESSSYKSSHSGLHEKCESVLHKHMCYIYKHMCYIYI